MVRFMYEGIFMDVAKKLGMNLKLAEDIAQQVQVCVEDDLGEFIFKR